MHLYYLMYATTLFFKIYFLFKFISFELVYKKGYQSTDTANSIVTTKVKGLGKCT